MKVLASASILLIILLAPLSAWAQHTQQGTITPGSSSGEITSVTYDGTSGLATNFTVTGGNPETNTVINVPNPTSTLTDTIRDAAENDRSVIATWEQTGLGPKNLKSLTVSYD